MDKKQRIGTYLKCSVGGEHYSTYVPKNLPPKPPLDMGDVAIAYWTDISLNLSCLVSNSIGDRY